VLSTGHPLAAAFSAESIRMAFIAIRPKHCMFPREMVCCLSLMQAYFTSCTTNVAGAADYCYLVQKPAKATWLVATASA
jgi:hypothetical protein